MSSSILKELTDPDQAKTGLVLVKFWAAWCGPCKSYGTTFENAAQALAISRPDLQCVTANVDDEKIREYAERFGVRAIPYTLLVNNGKEVWHYAGLTDGANLVGSVTKAIKGIQAPTPDSDL